MERREFLRIGAAGAIGAAMAPRLFAASSGATVLYDDRAVVLRATGTAPGGVSDPLWIRTVDLPGINGFEIKPEGACRADVCIPLPAGMTKGGYFNLNAFAAKIGQAVVADDAARVWSFGEIPAFRSGLLTSRVAPDVALPDRAGQLVRLSAFRGRKVLLVTWATWCGCRFDLPHWQTLYEELRADGLEIILVAQDTAGPAVTERWYAGAKVTYPALNDPTHAVSSAFDFVNVPAGVWIDEQGRVARPGEPAWATDNRYEFGDKAVVTDGVRYVAAVRDWVSKGDRSQYVLSDTEFARRVQPPPMAAMEADAAFKLGAWFYQAGQPDRAQVYFERAQRLDPDNWNYHRQAWAFDKDGGKQWLEKFQQMEGEYYPRLKLTPGDETGR